MIGGGREPPTVVLVGQHRFIERYLDHSRLWSTFGAAISNTTHALRKQRSVPVVKVRHLWPTKSTIGRNPCSIRFQRSATRTYRTLRCRLCLRLERRPAVSGRHRHTIAHLGPNRSSNVDNSAAVEKCSTTYRPAARNDGYVHCLRGINSMRCGPRHTSTSWPWQSCFAWRIASSSVVQSSTTAGFER